MSLFTDYKLKQFEIEQKKNAITEQLSVIKALEDEASEIKSKIKIFVEENGETTEAGYRAYLQIRNSVSYDPDKFIAKFPNMKDLVTEVIVKKTKIGGLLKGGLLKEEDLEDCKEVSVSKAFYLEEVKE